MTWTVKMADARYDGYEDGFDEGFTAGREAGLQQGLKQGIEQGLEQGAYKKALETEKNLLSMNFSPEQVAQGTNLPLDVVQGLL